MKRTLLAAAALSAMFAFGCDKSNEAPTPEAQKTADNAADTAKDKLSDIKGAVKEGTSEAKDQADKNADAAKNQADAMKDQTKNQADAMKDQAKKDEAAAKTGAENNQSTLDDLISKAKSAVSDKRWTDADNYVKQIEDLKGKLPVDQQPKVDAALTPLKQAIDMGKKAMPGT